MVYTEGVQAIIIPKGRRPYLDPKAKRVTVCGRISHETALFIESIILSLPKEHQNQGRAIDKIVMELKAGQQPSM